MINRIEIVFFFWKYSSQIQLPTALKDLANLMPETSFYSKLKFAVEILKRLS